MARINQDECLRGSQKWIQRAVNFNPAVLNNLILPKLDGAATISWRSPLSKDHYAEYSDAEFLREIGASDLATDLANFWPDRGPNWDALAVTDRNDIVLVEGKAHIGELCSSPTSAGPISRKRIEAALDQTALAIGAKPLAPWTNAFYQLANRLAYLHFLRERGLQAWLVLINFVGDTEMNGPKSADEWTAAYHIVWHVMGMPKRYELKSAILEIFPPVESLA